MNPLETHRVYAEGNMVNISKTIPINIFHNPNVVKNVFIGEDYSSNKVCIYADPFKDFCDIFAWSYEEMPGIDP
jgi:hypothetical protein